MLVQHADGVFKIIFFNDKLDIDIAHAFMKGQHIDISAFQALTALKKIPGSAMLLPMAEINDTFLSKISASGKVSWMSSVSFL
jgi:hypothetical protein